MLILSLEVENFRNLARLALSCAAGLNLILGANACGKTSLLEALYFVGRARSFRSRQARELIRYGEAAFHLVAAVGEGPQARRVMVGIQRSPQELTVRLDGRAADSLAELAAQTPLLLLDPNSHRLLEGGPEQRRRFMDWGLFHTEPAFWMTWKRYGAALRNRNAALKAQAPNRTLEAWDQELAAAAIPLSELRKAFCDALEGVLRPLISQTLGKVAVTLDYRSGWPQKGAQSLLTLLRASREQDRRLGYTQVGAQRADFTLKAGGGPVTERLSRGQRKLLVIALVLAQARLHQERRGSPCILLIDDLPAELDRWHREQVMRCLAGSGCQLFVTALERGLLDSSLWSDVQVIGLDNGGLAVHGPEAGIPAG